MLTSICKYYHYNPVEVFFRLNMSGSGYTLPHSGRGGHSEGFQRYPGGEPTIRIPIFSGMTSENY
jgi:hypothetical protein